MREQDGFPPEDGSRRFSLFGGQEALIIREVAGTRVLPFVRPFHPPADLDPDVPPDWHRIQMLAIPGLSELPMNLGIDRAAARRDGEPGLVEAIFEKGNEIPNTQSYVKQFVDLRQGPRHTYNLDLFLGFSPYVKDNVHLCTLRVRRERQESTPTSTIETSVGFMIDRCGLLCVQVCPFSDKPPEIEVVQVSGPLSEDRVRELEKMWKETQRHDAQA